MRVIVDRIEEDRLVLETDDGFVPLPLRWFQGALHEGDLLDLRIRRTDGGVHCMFQGDPAPSAARRDEIKALRASIPEGPCGDLEI